MPARVFPLLGQREALLERTCVVKFVNVVPKDKRDPEVLKRLTHDETELTAALAFVVQGRFDRLDYGLEVPESIKQISEEFETTINPLVTFVKNEIIFDNGTNDEGHVTYQVQTMVKDLYERFLETTDLETRKKVGNERSFNVHFRKVA